VVRGATLRWLFMDLARLDWVGRGLRLYQQLGVQAVVRWSGVLRLLPARWRELEGMTPAVQPAFSSELIAPMSFARGRRRARVAMLTGCAQDLFFSDVNRDTVEVLVRNGCEVITPPSQGCCGSLHAHNGEWGAAQALARRQIDALPPEEFDAIITNAAGCGSHLKHYAKLLGDDAVYGARARLWDRRVKDIHEWLVEIGFEPPAAAGLRRLEVTYHEACHLSHGQKVVSQPRAVLRAIPHVNLVELEESTWCCGSAGIYNLIQPQMAGELLQRKVGHIRKLRVDVVATANPGCMLQVENGLRREFLPVRVAHPVSLLAEAYRAEAGGGQQA
jgi:glycolate oxidase iron-sulfur subunit